MEDYSTYTLAKLKERCRDRGLMVSGAKAILLQRVMDDVNKQIQEIQKQQQSQQQKYDQRSAEIETSNMSRIQRPRMASRLTNDRIRRNTVENISKSNKPYSGMTNVDADIIRHLDGLIKEYILACGGQAGSRDVGRYLAANSSSKGREADFGRSGHASALTELKNNFGSLNQFLANRRDVFFVGEADASLPTTYGFSIRLI